MQSDVLWTIDDLMKYLRCNSYNTVYHLVRTRQIPSCKIGKELCFEPEPVKEAIRKRFAKSNPEIMDEDIREIVHGLPS